MGVQAIIMTAPKEVMGLPMEAVIKEGDDYFAYSVIEGRIEKFSVKVIQVHSDFIECTELPDGDLITSGAYYLE
jgi:cobalt-zinc-cadmium efflux system membrane fusion protein